MPRTGLTWASSLHPPFCTPKLRILRCLRLPAVEIICAYPSEEWIEQQCCFAFNNIV